jgi:hypothetical protein
LCRTHTAGSIRDLWRGTGEPDSAVSLPARQQRALDLIGKTLAADDPALESIFGIFTRLTLDEPMPVTERVSARLKRLLRPAMVIPIALIAVLSMLIVSFPVHSRNICRAVAAESRVGRALSCSPAPAKP